jgi:hypothetical protein
MAHKAARAMGGIEGFLNNLGEVGECLRDGVRTTGSHIDHFLSFYG